MDTRYKLFAPRRAGGAIRPVALAAIIVVVLLIVAVWVLVIRPHQLLVNADRAPATPAKSTSIAAAASAPPPADVAAMDLNQLLSEARTAINQQRYLAPAGNNAFEFYLRALERQPGNPVANEALREIFPFASNSAEQSINQRNFIEAQREIDLLAKADPTNFTLTILRSKLDAQRKLLDKEQQQQLDQQKAQLAAQQKAAADKVAADRAEAEQAQQSQQQAQLAAQQRAAEEARQRDAAQANTASAPPAAAAEASTPAIKISTVNPRYPSAAARAKEEGYVVVSFTVTPDGDVTNATVTDSQPRRVFDRSALDAVQRWRFKAATRNGKPVSSKVSNRISFRLNGN